jgi:thiamine pyrophosphate-dependent acetolactate synthase large subunit-like protein
MKGTRMSLAAALAVLQATRSSREVIVTTMGAARDWMAMGPLHPLDFVLVPSSMGQATSLGLGLALGRPDLRVTVVNGDGSMLMNLGSLVSIASERPRNLMVLIADNGAYEVTGAQPTPGLGAGSDLEAVARACGIRETRRYADADRFARELSGLRDIEGPVVVVLDVAVVPGGVGPRSPGPAGERARRFMAALAET